MTKRILLALGLIVALPALVFAQTTGPIVGVSDPPTSVDLSDLPPGPQPLVNLVVSGGFVPDLVHLDVQVDTDGLVKASQGEKSSAFRLDTDGMARLKWMLGTIAWSKLAPVYRVKPYGADMPGTTIKHYPAGTAEKPHVVGLVNVWSPELPLAFKKLTDLEAFLTAAARAVLGEPAVGLKATVTTASKSKSATFKARLGNPGTEAVGFLYPNYAFPQFLVRRYGKTVYDSTAMMKYVKIALIPRVHVLMPGESWKLSHTWDYHRNVPETMGGPRVPAGFYQVRVRFSEVLSSKTTSSKWEWFWVPAEPK